MKYLKIGATLLFFLILLLSFLVIPRILIIKNISCSNQYGDCSENLELELEKAKGKSLIEAKKEIAGIMKQNLFVKEYTLRYEIPDKIRIYTIAKKAKFSLKNIEVDIYALIDQDGMVLGFGENSTLPKVIFAGKYAGVGETVGTKELFALNLISSLYYFYQVKEGMIVEDRLEVRMSDGVTVTFPLEGDRDILLGSLKVILSRLNEDAKDSKIKKVSQIDLRFKNPVLK